MKRLVLLIAVFLAPLVAHGQGAISPGSLPVSGATAGTYTNPTLTINAAGQTTSAASGPTPLTAGSTAAPNPRLIAQGYAGNSGQAFAVFPCDETVSPYANNLYCNNGVLYFGNFPLLTLVAGSLTLPVPSGIVKLGCDTLNAAGKGCQFHAGIDWVLQIQNAYNTVESSYWGHDHYGANQNLNPPSASSSTAAYGDYFHNPPAGGAAVRTDSLQMASESRTCNAANRGIIDYVAGASGVKDIGQLCAKDASDAYAWRTIY